MLHYNKIPKVFKPNIWLESTISPSQDLILRHPRYNLWTKTKRAGICLSLVCSHIIRIYLSLVFSHVIKISSQLYSQHSNMFRVTYLTFSGNFVMIPQDSRIKTVIKSRFLYIDVGQPFWWARKYLLSDALLPILLYIMETFQGLLS